MSNTDLSNFNFGTFYHQTKLESLDISYNKLYTVDFTAFARKFNDLRILNLEGNQLENINTITHRRFPKLTLLGLSNNRLSCGYLADFVENWPTLKFIYNPSNKPHIDGVNCLLLKDSYSYPEIDMYRAN